MLRFFQNKKDMDLEDMKLQIRMEHAQKELQELKGKVLALPANSNTMSNLKCLDESLSVIAELLTESKQAPAEHQNDYRTEKISELAKRESLTQQEAEAVLCHLDPTGGYQKNMLLALQALNRHAAANKIRVEDSITFLLNYV
jgi:hypothetical protein